MSVFSKLFNKVFGRSEAPAAEATTPTPAATTTASPEAAPQNVVLVSAQTPTLPEVDVEEILNKLAANAEDKDLDWKHSIVDLLKVVGMDSSLSARKELAHDLNYTGDTDDSAKMNVWLIKAVLKKFSENGGKLPSDLNV